jgi:hypothetical protein
MTRKNKNEKATEGMKGTEVTEVTEVTDVTEVTLGDCILFLTEPARESRRR